MGQESIGSARRQIGLRLAHIGVKLDEEDALGIANHTRFLVALSAPYLLDVEGRGKCKTCGHPLGMDRFRVPTEDEVEDEGELLERCMQIVEDLTPILSEAGIYAFLPPEVEDAGGLALKDTEAGAAGGAGS